MIDPSELIGLRVSADGKTVRLHVKDQTGQKLTFSLPVGWLNAILNVLPRSSEVDTVHPVDSWSMERICNNRDLVLTLRTPDGQSVSFAIKPWQIEGMATIATYGNAVGRTPETTLH
jgi:hypothetical protein